MKYLADTTLIIESLRGDQEARDFIDKFPEISIVTVAEVIQGCRDASELKIVDNTCEALHQEKIDTSISQMAVNLVRKHYLSHGLLLLDALIAATCILRNRVLVTENIKHFRFIEDLEVISHKQAFGETPQPK